MVIQRYRMFLPDLAAQAEHCQLSAMTSLAFLRRHIGPWLAEKHQKDDVLLGRLRAAEIGLSTAADAQMNERGAVAAGKVLPVK